MNLNEICQRVGAKVLGIPGTIVKYVNNSPSIGYNGEYLRLNENYVVTGLYDRNELTIDGTSVTFNPRRFHAAH